MTAAPAVFDRLSALADPIRGRLVLLLEHKELTVREIQAALQLPQSTVSRHLKTLADHGLVVTRSEGTSNWYRTPGRDQDPGLRRLWLAVRDEVAGSASARRDAMRLQRILADRHLTSQRFFESAAGQWDRLRAELFGDSAETLGLLGLIDERWVVGDLGCGSGQVSAALAPFVRQVIAIDESAAMLKSARHRTRDLPNVEIRTGTLEAPPLGAGELDAALLMLVLHHATDPSAILARVRPALKPGGKLLVVDMQPHEHIEYREQMGHQWLGFEATELGGWLADAGFSSTRVVPLPPGRTARGPALFAATATHHEPLTTSSA